jgi:hypothetical protein
MWQLKLGGHMKNSQINILIALALLIPVAAAAKQKKETSNVFDAPADRAYDAAYKYAQHHGTIKYSSDKQSSEILKKSIGFP